MLDSFNTFNVFMFVVLSIILIGISIWLYNKHNDNKSDIDLADLVMLNGHISDGKLIRFGSWVISSWGFIYLVLENSLTEWFFLYYMGAWVANALISKHISRKADNEEIMMNLSKGKTVRKPGDNFDPSDGE